MTVLGTSMLALTYSGAEYPSPKKASLLDRDTPLKSLCFGPFGVANFEYDPSPQNGNSLDCSRITELDGCQNYGPFWVLNIIRHLISRVPKKGP